MDLSGLPIPSRETYEWILFAFTLFPLATLFQWIPFSNSFYQMGKTSGNSKWNLPGKIAWFAMEIPGFLSLLYTMNVLPAKLGIKELPLENKVLGGLYVLHYIYRAVLFPIINPSMSPIVLFVWTWATSWQFSNGLSLGLWLGGYGPTTRAQWGDHIFNPTSPGKMELGLLLWVVGFLGNIYHDEILREIRRKTARKQAEEEESLREKTGGKKKGVDKVYLLPEGGLFEYVLYPHYLCEWVEWSGFWIMAGLGCVPARNFLINEVATMLARAVEGKAWYEKKFGREKVGKRAAVIPGLI